MSKLIDIMFVPMLTALLCALIIGCAATDTTTDTTNTPETAKEAKEEYVLQVGILKVGDKVVMRPNIIGTILRITKGPDSLYHIKVFNEDLKGHVVHRVPESNVFEFVEQPR